MKLSSRPFPTFARMLLVGLLLGSALAALPQQPAQAAPLRATITVTDFADVYGGPTCTLRNAIQAANTNAAFGGCPAGNVGMDTIQLDAGTYTLSVPNLGGNNEDNNATGDLDIHDSLTIQGAGMGSTIIRGGTSGGTSGNGIDKVIAANPVCANQVSINISNLTIANGRNTQPYDTSGDWSFTGGGMDYFGCTAGDLTLTNVMFLNNVNVYGYGGGLNIDSGGSYGGTIRLDNVTFQGNITQGASGNESNGGGLNLFGENPTVIINNCTFQGNQVQNASASGGGVYIRLYSYAPGPSGNVHISNTLVQNNTSGGKGGGIYVNYAHPSTVLVIDNNTRVLNNVSGAVGGGTGGGGGIALDGSDLATTPARLSKIVVSGNSEGAAGIKQGGAGIYVGMANAIIEYSRIANNASGGQGSGLFKSTDTGVVNAANNWWGCSTGPSAAPCDTAVLAGGSAGSLTHIPYLQVRTAASPSTLLVNQTAAITADATTNSAGSSVAANIERLIGLPVAWSTTAGSLSSTQTALQAGGTATATFTATQAGTSLVAAKVDNDATTNPASFNVASITVNKADTTTVLSGHTPDPSLAGTAVAVTYTVTSATGSVPTAPGGNVTVSDGVDSCTAAASAGTCSLTLTTPGIRSLTAVYAGDANFNTSTSAAVSHVVQQPPLITSADNATFTYNTAGSFTVSTTGYPLATLSSSGTLPTGVNFTPNADGTATLAGTPSQSGSFPLTITASNGVSPNATQTFTLTVQRAPEFTSAASATFTVGTAGSFDVTINGFPAAVISTTSALPGGLTLSSTGTLAGTPVPGTGGVYTLTLTAANGVSPDGTQTFTLTVNEAPAFTSAASDTFVAGTSRTFDITTSGHPAVSALTLTGDSLPAGVTFTDNGNGTATLSGTPADDTGGSYALVFGAANGIGTPASQSFTLTVNEAPEFTSVDNTTFTVGSAGSFTISTQAFPLVTDITMIPGLLPSGVSFMNNSNGTATLSGTPAVGTGGTYSLQFLAQNGIAPNALQNFTLTVNEAPSITSAASDTFEVGTSRTFNITTDGVPAVSAVSLTSGTLPSGMTFTDGGSSATLSGTPDPGTGGSYALVFGATNTISPDATQTFTLTVNEAPAITSIDNATFTVGTAGSFDVTSSGFPAASFVVLSGTLPGGVTLSSSGTLAGTPVAGSGGVYPLTLSTANGVSPDGTQSFTLTVNEAPSITSAATTTFAVGVAGSFDITTDGTPAVSAVSLTGDTLPSGVTFANGGSSATLSGTPAVGSGGSYALVFGATNTITPDASQNFTLLVNEAPAITSIDNATFTLNAPSSFTVTSSGFPAAAISESGALPPGVTWTDNGNGTGTLAGTPTTSGSFPLSFTASNGMGSADAQNFTLTVNLPPAFTSVNITSFVAGMPGSFSVTTSGDPIPVVSMTGGTLPPGVTFTPNAGGTATLAGTPPLGTGGAYILNLKAASGALPDATQTFFLLVLQAPQFTNAASATFNAGAPNNFTFTTNGYVNVSDITLVSSTPALPAGLSFVDNHNGTALLSGTPAAGIGGTYVLELSGYNGTSPDASQTFTLTVNEAPAITSADNHSIVIGSPVNFTITTTGYPVPGISYTGSLDPNVTFTDNLNGTATLAGTPSVSGAFILNLTAANSISPDATQTFTLTVTDPPFITSAANTAFTVGTAGSFTITTTGYPLPGISYTSSPALPASITLVDNGNGTATLGGTPAAGTGGVYNLLLTASNGVSPDATQSFVLTVNEDLAFTNADNASFALGSPVNFTITTTGYPLPGISYTGSLPAGVTFTDNLNGTATLAGTATASGAFTLNLTASNGISPDAAQTFTLTVNEDLAITSAASTIFTVGSAGTFTITTTGYPLPGITFTGTLPAGVSMTDNLDGTATLAGTPTESGVFTLTLTASNGISQDAIQTFTLTVNEAPAITSAANTTFTVGTAGTFMITTTGYPLPGITSTGALPAGVTFTDNLDGTATLAGTPTESGVFTLNLTAANGISPDATQTFTLTVNEDLAITSAASTTFTVGTAGTFTITTTGYPLPGISYTGALPAGVSLTDNLDGTATLAGTPSVSGVFTLNLTAANGVSPDATQSFTLTVNAAPAITSAASTIFTVGTAGTFTITTTGYPLPVISSTSTLPGGVTLTDNGNGTATLAGTPALGTGGSYPLTIDAANGVLPNATQTFTLTVWEAPNFTSADNTDFFVGSPGSFTVTTIGYPPNYLEYSGTLPWGFTFTDHDDNTATLAGTPADGDGGEYPLIFRAVGGVSPVATQNFTLRINEAPEFTNVDHTTFPVGAAGSFMFTTDGYPARLWVHMNSSLPALPASLTYTDNGDGTGTLSGTPAAGDEGVYVLSMETTNEESPNGTQTFTLTIANSPAITSANNTTFTAGTAGNFIVTSTGLPLNTLTQSGTLPGGVTFTDNGDNTATLGGTPAAGTGGVYSLTFGAENGILPNATQTFTLTVNEAPAITSANNAIFPIGAAGSFTITTTGYPGVAISQAGGLPTGVTFTDNGNGTATLAGTPGSGSSGAYALTFTASNGVSPDDTQAFTLTVNEAPVITSAANTTFVVGTAGSFIVTTTGFPLPGITLDSGTLPAGVSLTDHGDGTATLAGTPALGTGGSHTFTIGAANGVLPNAQQTFTLTVNEAPTFTSADNWGFLVGSADSFTVTTNGYPLNTLTQSGSLPASLSFTDNGDNTATLEGTPVNGEGGEYPLTFTAVNGITPDGSQSFSLRVFEAPEFTNVDHTGFVVGAAGSFMFTTDGYPASFWVLMNSSVPPLPASLTYTDNGDGTGTLSGTPVVGDEGVYVLSMETTNEFIPNGTQTFTLTIGAPPAITSANNTAFTAGSLGSFTITTTGYPAAVVSLTGGTLPGGVTLTDNGDGTATLGGTPDVGTGGVYTLTFSASNGISPDATQTFTLTVNQAPAITSAANTTFGVGTAGTFTITTTGYPDAVVSLTGGTLPGGVTLTDNGDGTATLGGTPDAGTGGVYSLTLTASNGVSPDATQTFTLTINQAPAITSAANTTFVLGTAGSFTVTTTGYPAAVVSLSGGTLPGGVTLTDNGDGTATLGGTPAAGTGGVYALTFTASNGVSPDATQSFTLTVNQAPAITSANSTTFAIGAAGSIMVTTTGYPTATVALTGGTLPGGVTLTDNGDGTATLGGTPAAGTGGVYSLTFTASNGISPDATQSFTLTVNQAPAITSANSTLFAVGSAGNFTITTTGYPDAVVSLTGGTLPGGVTLTDNGDGTATLGGTPAAGTGGVYTLTFTASNGVSPDATQSFTLTVNQAPAITSANSTTFAIGAAGSFTVTTTGYPTATVALSSGTLPGGVTLTDNGDGTATLGGTPDVGTGGVYSLTFTAGNGVSPDATQIFTLTVNQAPAITSAANTTFVVGTAGSFTVTTTGYPAAVVSLTGGTLPGGVTLTDNGDGTATLGGTPAASTGGVYALTFTASNGVSPDATQSFTLTINEAPDITSANSTTFAVGTLGDFTITTTGYPAAVVSLTGGTLPGGVTLTDNGDGTASLGGTPDAGTGGVYSLTFAASNGVSPDATQSFILTVNQAPAITSANNTLFTVGSAGNFTITTTGYPTATVALTGGTLPGGVTLTDNGDGTATLGGTPDAGTGGVYSLTFNASNGVLPDATQTFTLTVNQAPAITSANSATFAIGAAGSFTVTTTGYPIAAISYTSIPALPASITLVDNGDGTATLAGTPAASDGGTYVLSLSAVNGVLPDAAQTFTLTVNQSPVFTSADQTTFTVGTAGTFNVTTTGYPDAAVTLSAGSLPAGITLIDQGDGSAILGGTAAAGTGGTYTLTLNASNGALPDATQTFTLTVNEAPVITSVNNATFTVGTLGDFTITTAGFPAAGVTLTGGTLPGGVTLTDNGDGTATLGGTPTAGTGGVYSLTFTASNGVSPNATQSFTLTINEAPAITSANNTAFTVGTLGSFTVTTTSYPTAGVTLTGGTLPGGVTLTDNGDGTASLGGTPAAGTGGVYTLTFTASNGVSPDATQSFTFTINQAPAITSASNTAFTVGTAGSFMVTTTGYPINTIGQTGTLPDGLTFVDNGDNTAQLAGTPTAGSGGSYLLNLSAANGVTPDAAQVFTLTVYEAPRFTSAASVGFTTGAFGTFAIVTEGYPDAGISYTSSPALPASLSLIDNGDGTATLSGTPLAGDGGVYVISLSAGNGVDPDASQTLTLTIGQGPAITSAASTLFTAGTADSFTVTSTGFPANTLSRTGALPAGVSFVDNGDNTALFSGTPAAGTGGVYPLTITAANGVLPDATQNFTLTVNASPVFTSANATTFIVGNAGTFSITTDAYPAAVIAFTGTLPGGVTLVDNGNGTATLSGTPAAGTSGVYTLNLAAANGVLPDATQSFTLTVSSAPVITSADAVTFITGTAGSFTVTSLGSPMPTLSSSGALPAGVSFVPNADGTATLSGTASTSGTYPLVFTAANGVLPDATQNFTLTVEGPGGVVLINSVADTGDGVLAEGEHTPAAITQLLVTFNKDMNTVSAQNPANYALITGTTPISIDSITYTAATRIAALSINGGAALLDNAYTLTVKGALTDLAGYPLGADFVRNFVIDTRAPQVIAFITSDSRLIADNAVLNATFTRVQVQFNEDISDPVGGIGIDDVTNPQNYLLFQAGKDGVFNTTTCAAGITPDDVQISTGPVVYPYAGGAAYTALVTLNNGAALPNGVYRLMVCGTTSIVDMAGNKLNGGRDEVLNFSIQRIEEADVIPATGFAPGRVTPLPEQPASVVYKDMGSLWLEIPSLGVSSTITGAPFQNDNWDVTWLYDQVGWLQGTAYPTWAGNTVLTAHIYTADGAPGPFVALKEMKYNEVILLHYAGMKYTYALRSNFLVNPNNTSWITRHEKLDWLTLITCQQFNEKTQAYDYRRVVRAVLVKVEPEQ